MLNSVEHEKSFITSGPGKIDISVIRSNVALVAFSVGVAE